MRKTVAILTSILMLTSCTNFLFVQAAHSYETTMTNELSEVYLSRENDYCNENGVFYSTKRHGELEFDPLETEPGCFDRSPLLLALLSHYPNALFGVQIDCTYGTDLSAEIIRLENQGIKTVLDEETNRLVSILNVDQLENFPVSTEVGYKIGLAQTPSLTPDPDLPKYGDVNGDGEIDVMDAVYISKYLLGSTKLTKIQMEAADCNRDGIVDEVDSLDIIKYIVGVIDTFGYINT